MPLKIVRNDITKMQVDAIVNAANETLLGGGGVDGAIHRAAGPGLLAECRTLGGCETGDAKITGAYRLPCRYVIHTVGPVWQGGNRGEQALLVSCYRRSLHLAKENGCETVAFPLISSGVYGYPKDQALSVAIDTISDFLLHDADGQMTAYIVIYDKDAVRISEKLFSDIAKFIDDTYVEAHTDASSESRRSRFLREAKPLDNIFLSMVPEKAARAPDEQKISHPPKGVRPATPSRKSAAPAATLDDAVRTLDESFSEMLLRKIDERGITDAQCYKKANIDRKLFSKIRSDRNYRPSKPTVLAFAIALELPLAETQEMLKKAGFALSHSNKFDIIVEFFIQHGNYNIFEINEALFAFDQNLLGS